MDNKPNNSINKYLILRERLTLQRTAMSNDTTLLSFIRTALYFSITGMLVNMPLATMLAAPNKLNYKLDIIYSEFSAMLFSFSFINKIHY